MPDSSYITLMTGNLNCPFHANPEFEVIYVKRGRITVSYENKSVLLPDGEAAVILPFNIHRFEADSCIDATVFMFANSVTDDFLVGCDFDGKFSVSAQTDAYISKLVSAGRLNLMDTRALFYAFASESTYIAHRKSYSGETLRNVMEFIYSKIDEDLHLENVASELGISKRSLTVLFKERLNISFNDFLNSVRIEESKKMILKGELSITEIAYKCGFGSIRNFNRIFRQFVRCSPTEYKKLLPYS